MAKCRPSKWVPYAIPGVLLPFLAAHWLQTEPTVQAVQTRASQALSGEVAPWAKTEYDGRDVTIIGSAPSQEAIDTAVKTVAGTYGVRTVMSKVQIVEPVKLAAPTVDPYLGNSPTPTITGTWPEAEAVAAQHTLNVQLGETLYELGKSPELTSDGSGKWKLIPSVKLPEGSFDIVPSLVGPAGLATVAAATVAKAVIDLTPPAAPAIAPLAPDFKWPSAITGTWPEEQGSSLSIKFNGNDYAVGKSADLTSDGKGNFTFAPKVELAPGSYDVDFTVNDAAGNVTTQSLKAAVVIPEVKTEEPAAPPAAAPKAVSADIGAADGVVNGSWDSSNPNYELQAKFQGRTYVLDRGSALATTEAGKFAFTPQTNKLAPGAYDVEFAMVPKDGKGDVISVTANRAIVVAAPPPPPHAALEGVVATTSADGSTVTGTFDNDHGGHTLTAMFNGRTYVLDRGTALTSTRFNAFQFTPRLTGLTPGKYDVEFITSHKDGTGAPVSTVVAGAIVVPEPPPPPPPPAQPHEVAAAAKVESTGTTITGTWDNSHPTHSLSAVFQGRTYVLGRGAALTSPEPGKFSFSPRTTGLAPGAYDVQFVTSHSDGSAEATTVTAEKAIVVAEPPPPAPPPAPPHEPAAAPVVDAGADDGVVNGTWDNAHPTHQLSAKFQGRTFVLDRGAALSSTEPGKFTFAPRTTGLASGKYDVEFVTSHTDGSAADTVVMSAGVIVVPEPPPPPPPPKIELPAPTITSMKDATGAPIIKGTWPSDKATKLSVTLNGRTYVSGQDANLGIKGSDWTLLPGTAVENGIYDLNAVASDDAGNIGEDKSSNELEVAIPPPPPPPPPPPTATPYDCVAVMTRISNVFPIRFEYDLTDITRPFELSVSQYAALLKDPRCTSINVNIDGHADFRGSEGYNEDLGMRRAEFIKKMLVDAGVDASRLTALTFGESRPLNPETTDEARAVNRRVELSAKP
jgi:outer membrane protein OmpA-like peptidoglycan-associated protein